MQESNQGWSLAYCWEVNDSSTAEATYEVRKGIVELYSCLFWTEDGLSYITSAHTVGTPLFEDSLTESGNRLSYARICIQIDARVVLPDTVDVLYGNGCNATVTVNHGRQLIAPLAVYLASQIHSVSLRLWLR